MKTVQLIRYPKWLPAKGQSLYTEEACKCGDPSHTRRLSIAWLVVEFNLPSRKSRPFTKDQP
jgi:hypothetical protein